ncbi:hypothetical protein ACFQOY_09030 [Enterococcus alcedinis]|uniref:Uncharacterized protein n=1 Tax=Enterococcus alcedinis TaxID=1274384 RepID=A0A917JFX6_9ENTE|nr:hypothetical protein [Enterococcus alcedinis]MBP2101645.1 hypothetical protein [Enterococcus alcedinis]GGI64961.1 hypothetical protein GCM10011482_06150 [Enterococcus alcedinis]
MNRLKVFFTFKKNQAYYRVFTSEIPFKSEVIDLERPDASDNEADGKIVL